MNDNEVMILVRDGNKDAYEILIKKYMLQAKAFACKYIHDSYAAEDIVQESFADIYVQRFEFNLQFKFSTYLYTIIKYKSLNYLKKNRELAMSSLDENTEKLLWEKNFINLVTPETEYFKKIEYEELINSIQRLKEVERNMLYLYAVEEHSYKEIAEEFGKTIMQVKIELFRSRKKIKGGGKKENEQ